MTYYLQRHGSHTVLHGTGKFHTKTWPSHFYPVYSDYCYPVGDKLHWCHTRKLWWQYDRRFRVVYYDDITYKINTQIDAIVRETRYTYDEVEDTLSKHTYNDRGSLETFMNKHNRQHDKHDKHDRWINHDRWIKELYNYRLIRDTFSPDMQNINNRHLLPAYALAPAHAHARARAPAHAHAQAQAQAQQMHKLKHMRSRA